MSSNQSTRNGLELNAADRFTHGRTVPVEGGVEIIVTQAFGPRGDALIGLSDVRFDGYPALTLKLSYDLPEGGERSGLVHLSPIHGDLRKAGITDIPDGVRCRLSCPVSGEPLATTMGAQGIEYAIIFLTPRLDRGSQVLLSTTWGHYHSRITNEFELISAWAMEDEDEGNSEP